MPIEFQDLFQRMQERLESPQAKLDPEMMIELVDRIRPTEVQNTQQINQNIRALGHALLITPNAISALQTYVLKLITQYKQTSLYADSGLLTQDGFWNQLAVRLGGHILPLLNDTTQLQDLIRQVFHRPNDSEWLNAIDVKNWDLLFRLMSQGHSDQPEKKQIKTQLLDALIILSYRVSSIGLHPEFIHSLPDLNEYQSPFLVQNREIIDFIEQYKKSSNDVTLMSVVKMPDAAQALVILDQCRDLMLRIRRSTKRIGVSINLTYLLTLLEQYLERIELLLALIQDQNEQQQSRALQTLIVEITEAHYRDKSVRDLLRINSELMALQITENASRTGGHYVSTDKNGLLTMYKSAAGAGAIIAVMATLKTLGGRLVLAPLMQAFMNSMIYALGFVFIHVLRFTVATKQPAMTAAALAATVQQSKGSKTTQLAELAGLIINIIRTQFTAILGNISIAIPVAALIAFLWQWGLTEPVMDHAKAAKTLHDLNPFTSLAIPHAAIAGVCLFLSGLIAGYFDNLAIYRKVGPRLKAHHGLQRLMKPERLSKFAVYIESNLGALAGNFLFGIMLGSMGTIGFILGLPLDIRHIAFASANFIQGLMTINGSPDIGLILVSFLGVLLIGLTNLFVSFTLTVIVALRARRVRFEQWKPLGKLVLTHFVTRPSDFFWPPKDPLMQTMTQETNKTSK